MSWNSKKWIRRQSQVAQIQKCPDGGWGWIVVLTSVISISNFSIMQRCFSIFYTYLMNEFNAEFSQVAWINGLFQAGYGVACPLTPGLINYFSYRKVTIASSIVACVSIAIASFQSSLLAVQICAGVIPGLCMGPIMISGFTVVSRYFDKKRNLATQILCGGLTMGGFFYCPTIQLLIDSYTWRGALLVIAGFFLQSTIAGAAMKPIVLEEDFDPDFLEITKKQLAAKMEKKIDLNNNDFQTDSAYDSCELKDIDQEKKIAQAEFGKETHHQRIESYDKQSSTINSSEEDFRDMYYKEQVDGDVTCGSRVTKGIKKLQLNVFGIPLFYFYTFAYVFFAAGYFSCLNYLVPYGKMIGLGDIEASTLVSAVMGGEIVTRVVTGYFLGSVSKPNRVLYMACYIGMLPFSFLFASFSSNYQMLLAACMTIGFFGGALDGLFSVFMGDAFGMKLYAAVFGYGNIIIHLFGMASTVVVGKLLDALGNISIAFYVGIGASITSAVLTLIMRSLLIKTLSRKERSQAESSSENSA